MQLALSDFGTLHGAYPAARILENLGEPNSIAGQSLVWVSGILHGLGVFVRKSSSLDKYALLNNSSCCQVCSMLAAPLRWTLFPEGAVDDGGPLSIERMT